MVAFKVEKDVFFHSSYQKNFYIKIHLHLFFIIFYNSFKKLDIKGFKLLINDYC
jgi:hypothetical protein